MRILIEVDIDTNLPNLAEFEDGLVIELEDGVDDLLKPYLTKEITGYSVIATSI